jgi:hypothetical protein
MSAAQSQVTALLKGMLEADGYDAIVHAWPENDNGPARIEIVAGADACDDCLVPKDVMRMVLANELPPGVRLENADLLYPGEG